MDGETLKLRMMAGAFLTCGDKILLLHRGMHKKLAPGMWSCVGGHMEPHELNDPAAACYREIEEEAGICAGDIENLRLRYITMRKTDGEIQTIYYYTGSVARQCELPECDEGTLHWVDISEITDLPMSLSVKEILLHIRQNRDCESVFLRAVNKDNEKITWVKL